MKFGRVLDGHAFHQNPLAVGQANHVRAHLFLRLVIRGDIIVVLQSERIPQFAFICLGPSHPLEVLPFYVADLASLHSPPPLAVPVDYSFAGNAYVLAFARADARLHLAILQIILLVGRK